MTLTLNMKPATLALLKRCSLVRFYTRPPGVSYQADMKVETPATSETDPEIVQLRNYLGQGKARCYNCGRLGHISYECRLPQVRKACYLCGNPGHLARDCPDKTKVQVCFRCRKTGHTTKDCPEMIPGGQPSQSYVEE